MAKVEKVCVTCGKSFSVWPNRADSAKTCSQPCRGKLIAQQYESARIKKIVSEVAGDADILVSPDIEAGNILYKCLLDLGNAKGAGIVVGAAKPVVLTSRSDSAETKLASIALAALTS